MGKAKALYVHVPFCSSICPYCDFTKVLYRKDWAHRYILRLKEEAAGRIDGLFSTVYVGGGTPSCLDLEDFEALLAFLSPYREEGGEFSLEANPESLDEDKIALLVRYGVNRVSLGAQSSCRKSLATLGRNHDFDAVRLRVRQLRDAGIENINLDWMYGFPGQSGADLRQDIDLFVSLKVPHLSAYSLILEPGTAYWAKGVKPQSDDEQAEAFEVILSELLAAGYQRYEVSNFAYPGYRCQHNLTYWRDEPYASIGLGASGYEGNVRYRITRNLSQYLSGDFAREEETLNRQSQIEDFFLCNLRLVEGFEIQRFNERFGMDFEKDYAPALGKLVSRGLLVLEGGRCRTSKRGMDLLDQVLLTLYE